MKITVVGAGNVGATCADVLAYNEVANEIVIVDIRRGLLKERAWTFGRKRQLIIIIPEP